MALKTKTLKHHSYIRAGQRYNIQLSRSVRKEIADQIHEGVSVLLEKQSNTRTVHLVGVNGKLLVPVVWDKKRHQVVTFLPKAYIRSLRRGHPWSY